MRNRIVLLITVIVIIVVAGIFYMQKSAGTKQQATVTPPQQQISPTATPNPSGAIVSPGNPVTYCTPQNLQAFVTLNPGAGNIYGTFTLKNISKLPCRILGGNFIAAEYDKTAVKNITVSHTGQTQPQPFIVGPDQTIYSQVHYPNGPQCQSEGLNQTEVTFTYPISPANTVAFENQEGKTAQIVQTCKSPTDMTEIRIWNMADKPIIQ